MDKSLPLISYALAAVSGICFLSGLAILSSEGRNELWTDLGRSYLC